MLIIGDDFAVVYENICTFSIEPHLKIPTYRDVFCKKHDEQNEELGVSLCAYTTNNRWVELGNYNTSEEAMDVIKAIGNASKAQSVLNL